MPATKTAPAVVGLTPDELQIICSRCWYLHYQCGVRPAKAAMTRAVVEFLENREYTASVEDSLVHEYVSAAFSHNRRKPRVKCSPQHRTSATPTYPFPTETPLELVNRLGNCVLHNLAQIRETEGPSSDTDESARRFEAVMKTVFKCQPWRGVKAQVRLAVVEDLQRRKRRSEGWMAKVPTEPGAPEVPPEADPVPF